MAAKYPHARWRPLGPQTQPRMTAYDIVCLHTMVGSLTGTDAYFRQSGYGGNESHFGVGHDGETFQWQDLDYSADANYRGSRHIISIETADTGAGFPKWNLNDGAQVPTWTPAQVDRLADLVAWLCRTYNIPPTLITDSKPGRRGIGYHRLGVPGYVVAGGELWSTARGKVCPGTRRIAQIPTVVDRARKIMGAPNPTPNPKLGEDELSQEQVNQIRKDIGFSRDQILTRLGVTEPERYPAKMSPENLAGIDPARRVDVGFARDQLVNELADLRELVEKIAKKVGIDLEE